MRNLSVFMSLFLDHVKLNVLILKIQRHFMSYRLYLCPEGQSFTLHLIKGEINVPPSNPY